jgi:hypothetical protein
MNWLTPETSRITACDRDVALCAVVAGSIVQLDEEWAQHHAGVRRATRPVSPPAQRHGITPVWRSAPPLVGMLVHLADEPFVVAGLRSVADALRSVALAELFDDPDGLARAVALLRDLGLGEGHPERLALKAHVRKDLHVALTAAEHRFGAESAVAAVKTLTPAEKFRPETWPAARKLRPHALAAWRASEAYAVGVRWRSFLLERLCILDYHESRVPDAVAAGRAALRATETAREPDARLSDVLVNLAVALSASGNLDDARSLFERALTLDVPLSSKPRRSTSSPTRSRTPMNSGRTPWIATRTPSPPWTKAMTRQCARRFTMTARSSTCPGGSTRPRWRISRRPSCSVPARRA